MDTPILLLAYKRPDTTKKVIDALRQVKPYRMFVACDGARESYPAEYEACMDTREIIDKEIDWPCEVKKLFREENLGCRKGVSTAIDWFFSMVDYGIILEDDCVPHHSFLNYCTVLLNYYRDDTRVMQIGGSNFFSTKSADNFQYFFSKHFTSWGWATWARAWKHFDRNLKLFHLLHENNRLNEIWDDPKEKEYREKQLLKILNNQLDSWAYIWSFSCTAQKAYSILPSKNMIKNVGFDNRSTHTKSSDNRAEKEIFSIEIETHPDWLYFPVDIERERLSRFIVQDKTLKDRILSKIIQKV